MRRLIRYVLAAVAGFFLAEKWAERMDAREKNPTYMADPAAQKSWGIIGAGLAVIVVLLRPFWLPVLWFINRHPKLSALFGFTAVFGANWVFWDAVEQLERGVFDGRGGPSAANQSRPRDWRFAGPLPSSADDVLGIGPSRGRRCRQLLSDGAYFDAAGAAAEQRMAEEYRRSGRAPGSFAS